MREQYNLIKNKLFNDNVYGAIYGLLVIFGIIVVATNLWPSSWAFTATAALVIGIGGSMVLDDRRIDEMEKAIWFGPGDRVIVRSISDSAAKRKKAMIGKICVVKKTDFGEIVIIHEPGSSDEFYFKKRDLRLVSRKYNK